MFFSKKKKIQRDRNAGLVFRWRGGYSNNRGGLTLAIIITSALFLLAFLGVKVYVSSTSLPSRYRAELIFVDSIGPDLRWMLERNSPFHCAWEGDEDELAFASLQLKKNVAIASNRQRKVNWQTATIAELLPASPVLYPLGEIEAPAVTRLKVEESAENPQKLVWNYVISVVGETFATALPEQKSYALNVRPLRNYQGRTLQFTVHLDRLGKVISALPLVRSSENEMNIVESWVKTLQFKPAKPSSLGLRTLVLNVSIQARKEAR